MRRCVLASHQLETLPTRSSLEVKDLKGQNYLKGQRSSQWQPSSILHHAAVKTNKLLRSAFVLAPD